jgi:hypothetical protein
VTSSACSPGSEDSTSPPKPSGIPAPRRSSGTPTAPESSSDTGPTFPDGEMSPGSPLLPTPMHGDHKSARNRTATRHRLPPTGIHDGVTLSDLFHPSEGLLTSSSEDSPASPSAPPAAARQGTMPAGSGPSSPVLLATYDPERSSSRTSEVSYRLVTWTLPQASLFGDLPSERFSETWPTSGMTQRGRCYELPMLARPISANVYSSSPRLATPTTGDTTPHYDHRISPGQKPRERPVPNLAAQVEDELLRRRSRGEPTNPPSEGGKR